MLVNGLLNQYLGMGGGEGWRGREEGEGRGGGEGMNDIEKKR